MSRRDNFGIPRDATMAAIYNQSVQQVVQNASVDVINFNNVEYDPYGLVIPGASWKFTVSEPGVYIVSSNIVLTAAGGEPQIFIYKNGVKFSQLYRFITPATFQGTIGGTRHLFLNHGDYIDIRFSNGTGGPKTINASTIDLDCYVCIYKA